MDTGSEEVVHWVYVARVGDLPPNSLRPVEVEGRRLVLVNQAGGYYAVQAVCPHQGGPLDEGALWKGSLECPWHRFRYDPATGKNVYPANVYPEDMPHLREQLQPVETFPVRVREESLYVGMPGRPGIPR